MTGGRYRRAALAALVLAGAGVGSANAQTVERKTKITGPRGNSVTRQIDTTRGPGFVDRNVQITRPGGATFDRNTLIQRGPVATGRYIHGGGYGPRIVENNYFVRGGGGPGWGTAIGIGGGLFGLGMLAGSAIASPPPPPVYYGPPPVVVAPPPAVVYAPPPRSAPPPVVDPVADAIGRLNSYHVNSRSDGCYTLGRLGDARAVNPLVDRLKNDSYRDVRVAAAWALGEIGDPRASVYLERSSTYDKKAEVRDAATRALGRLSRPMNPPPSSASSTAPAPAPSSINTPRLVSPGSPSSEPNLLPLPESDSAPPPLPRGSTPPPPPQRPGEGFPDRP
jgi:HEAT repeats